MTIVWTWQVRLTIQHFMTNPKTSKTRSSVHMKACEFGLRGTAKTQASNGRPMARSLRYLPLPRPLRRYRIREVVAAPDRTVHSLMTRTR